MMEYKKWKEISKTAVDFLTVVYGGDVASMASIQVMQAEQDIDGLCDALDGVTAFCEKLKSEIKQAKEEHYHESD